MGSDAELRRNSTTPVPASDSSRPGPVRRRLLAALALCGLLAACSLPPHPLPASSPRVDPLRYGLGGNTSLLVSSPDLEQRLAENRRQQASFALSHPGGEPPANLPQELNVELSAPDQGQHSKLRLHFIEEGRALDRASFDTRLRVQTWLLGFNARLLPTPAEAAGRSVRLASEFSGLLGPRQAAAATAAPDSRHSPAPGGDPGLDRTTLTLDGAAAPPPPQRYYLAFHDARLGADEDGRVQFLFSLGGFPAEDFGEVVTTFRLLSRRGASALSGGERGGSEQALGLAYTGYLSGWVKSFGHTLTYFDYQGAGETSELLPAGPDDPEPAASVEKWQSRVELSGGEDLHWPSGLLQGYRLDTHIETQAVLQRTGLLPAAARPAHAAWGSQLRLNTLIGTLSGKLSRSPGQQRLAFSLQKFAPSGARARLYYEDIDYRRLGELETRIGGQLNLPLDQSLLKVLTPGYWRRVEADLFAAQPVRGYTAPRRGRHVSTLDNAIPGILQ